MSDCKSGHSLFGSNNKSEVYCTRCGMTLEEVRIDTEAQRKSDLNSRLNSLPARPSLWDQFFDWLDKVIGGRKKNATA